MFSMTTNDTEWKNWAGTVYNQPGAIMKPSSTEEVIRIVKECQESGRSMRVIGAGHSFTPLAATSDVLLSLEHLSGIEKIDHQNRRVTIWGGTRLNDLGPLLFEEGYAMENLGDINAQAIAGAISTGTHGTGQAFGSLSTQVTSLTIITASGDLLHISREENEEYFEAARLSLGMLGVIIKLELQVVKAYRLEATSLRMPLTDCLSNLKQLNDSNRNFEFYWFPHTKTVQGKMMNITANTPKPPRGRNKFADIIVENGAFWVLSELCRTLPALSKSASLLSAQAVPTGKSSGYSHDMYATPRLVKFTEMEYSVPQAWLPDVLEDIQHIIKKYNFDVHFPIECRYVKADHIWLSPAYNRDSAYVAVHMYKGMPFQPYFDALEEVFRHYEGRPHWGKMHTMTYEELNTAYPQLQNFLDLRQELDPNGLFLNSYLQKLFGIKK
ncbi:L-gulonolactone oxidase [Lentibacillus sp. JNUCC-1]|uniref:D-arabinono-1,4-lactone oxidase n=1 Tax=Lentibacillus sp. JNUCC-1 TaxID=2654513 RepID=UPI0012E9544E|nr:D-arabinono-1,4-lactone oxidase [Lentibacillus sp. JNUCC-1]MUV36720.1 L-gulonolactone oxidase [Lentibacillus sp. JNUCC-1]